MIRYLVLNRGIHCMPLLKLVVEHNRYEYVKDLVSVTSSESEEYQEVCRKYLYKCASDGDLNLAKVLVKECGVDPNMGVFCYLHTAARNGHLRVVEYLIEECDVHPEKKNFLSPARHYIML